MDGMGMGMGMGFGGFLYATARWEDCCVYCLFLCVFADVIACDLDCECACAYAYLCCPRVSVVIVMLMIMVKNSAYHTLPPPLSPAASHTGSGRQSGCTGGWAWAWAWPSFRRCWGAGGVRGGVLTVSVSVGVAVAVLVDSSKGGLIAW